MLKLNIDQIHQKGGLIVDQQKDRFSLIVLLISILLINIFGDYLNSLIWSHFWLFMNCILAQALFLQCSNISTQKRSLNFTLSLLALLTGLITFFVILYSSMGLFNQIFFFIVQIAVTYAEVIQLKMSLRNQDEGGSK